MISLRRRQFVRSLAGTERGGFTVLETVLALGLVVIVIGLTAQAGYLARVERARTNVRQGALDAASNLLEAARAMPWQALTPRWAAEQHLPEDWLRDQPDGKLQVQVAPEASLPRTRRVTVTIRWDLREGIPPQEVQLTALFAAREEAP
jgi:hypothetical protein